MNTEFSQGPKTLPVHLRKLIQLRQEKWRLHFSEFLLEGPKALSEMLDSLPDSIMEVYASNLSHLLPLEKKLKKLRIRHQVLSPRDLRSVFETLSPQGMVAVAKMSTLKPDWQKSKHVTLLDGVQDPGNVGAIFRTSLALGFDALLLGKGTCDVYNPKVVRSSIGSIVRLPFEAGVDLKGKISFLRNQNFTILATSPNSVFTLRQARLRKKVALIVGNEGSGISNDLAALADQTVRIEVNNRVESLNVAVAHGILAYQLLNSRS